jgi:hypothetical protein
MLSKKCIKGTQQNHLSIKDLPTLCQSRYIELSLCQDIHQIHVAEFG